MKSAAVFGLPAAGILAILAALSFVHVPAGHFALAGKHPLSPGWRLKPFWVRARVYEKAVNLQETLHLRTREGALKDIKVTVEFTWDLDRLRVRPSDVPQVRQRLRTADVVSGPGLQGDLARALADLPVRDLRITLESEGDLPAEVRQAWHPTGRRIVFLGLDSMDWILIDRLIAQGRMPAFARFKREGAWANLQSAKPLLSPLLWTSIATSRPPDEHGILEFTIRDPATGGQVPITSGHRKVQTFWTILSAFKLHVNVVGWWATFPAEKINGTLVTERPFYSLFGIESPGDVPGNTYPPDAEKKFRPLMRAAGDISTPEIREYIHASDEEVRRAWEEGKKQANPFTNRINHLRKILAVTHSVEAIARALLEKPFDVTAVYLEGPDTMGHRFGQLLPPKLPWVTEKDFEMGKDALPRYYEEMDRVLADLVRTAPPDTLWIIASDHGFFTGEARPTTAPDDFTAGASEWHRLTGILLIHGPGVHPGKITGAGIYDIVPTLFHALGVPSSREWKGRALAAALPQTPPVPPIASYEFLPAPWKEACATAAPDAERIKELQALGYIGGAGQPSASPAPSPSPPSQENVLQAYNLAKSLFQKGELDPAMEQYRRCIEISPDFSPAVSSLGLCYALKGNHREAYRWLKKSLEYPRELPPQTLVKLVEEAGKTGDLYDALSTLEEIRPAWEREALYFVALGRARALTGNEKEAVEDFRHARELSPADPLAAQELLRRFIARKDIDGVAALLKSAWDASRGSIETMNGLGLVCLETGQGKIAEDIFRRVLESDPGNGGILANLAIALQMQGKSLKAREIFARAVTAEPDNAQLYFNYGMTLAQTGAIREALPQFLEAQKRGLKGPRLYSTLALTYAKLGRKDEALNAARASLALDPDQPSTQKLLRSLEK